MKRVLIPALAAFVLGLGGDRAFAQDQSPQPAPPQDEHAGHTMPAEGDHAGHEMVNFSPRDSSGTAWSPDFTPMYGYHQTRGAWEVMAHGNVFLQYLREGGEEHRTGAQLGSINWGMGMARRPLGGGVFGLRGMLSLEPATIGGCGYPVLLATGETCNGDSIHDRQHPHDLFMEVAAEYDRPISGATRWQLYGGLAGEPALGPAGFPHRLSAFSNLLAPMGHHWLDATHVTFGVLTTGVYSLNWKAEGSIFNGREPDEDRTDFDLGALDSYSGRVWFLPTERLAFQLSAGHLEDAEAPHGVGARHDVDRVTVSGTFHVPFRTAGYSATTIGWGMNRELGVATNALVAETALTPDDRNTWFGRFEIAEKIGDALHVHEAATEVFTLSRVQGGYARYLAPRAGLQAGAGFTVSASIVPEPLSSRYGGRVAPGFGVFLTLRAARM